MAVVNVDQVCGSRCSFCPMTFLVQMIHEVKSVIRVKVFPIYGNADAVRTVFSMRLANSLRTSPPGNPKISIGVICLCREHWPRSRSLWWWNRVHLHRLVFRCVQGCGGGKAIAGNFPGKPTGKSTAFADR